MNHENLETISDDMLDNVAGGGLIMGTIEFADKVIDGAVDAVGGTLSFFGGVISGIGGWLSDR